MGRAQRVVLLGDGASWIWELARNYFPDATCILDFWHASEYLSEMAQLLRTGDKPAATKLYEDWRGKMAESKIQEVLREATAHQEQMVPESVLREGLQKKINYLENQKERMDYARYRAEGLFIGSGVVEAGCKKVVGARFKCSGMFWSEPGARNLLQIRAALLSQNRFAEFWQARAS